MLSRKSLITYVAKTLWVVAAWPKLPDALRAGVVAMAQAACDGSHEGGLDGGST